MQSTVESNVFMILHCAALTRVCACEHCNELLNVPARKVREALMLPRFRHFNLDIDDGLIRLSYTYTILTHIRSLRRGIPDTVPIPVSLQTCDPHTCGVTHTRAMPSSYGPWDTTNRRRLYLPGSYIRLRRGNQS